MRSYHQDIKYHHNSPTQNTNLPTVASKIAQPYAHKSILFITHTYPIHNWHPRPQVTLLTAAALLARPPPMTAKRYRNLTALTKHGAEFPVARCESEPASRNVSCLFPSLGNRCYRRTSLHRLSFLLVRPLTLLPGTGACACMRAGDVTRRVFGS
jgi:hypothetical protein